MKLVQCGFSPRSNITACAIPVVSDEELIRRIKATNSNDVDNGLDGWVCRKCTRKAAVGSGPSKPIVVAEGSKDPGFMSRGSESSVPVSYAAKGHEIEQVTERGDFARSSKTLLMAVPAPVPLPKPQSTPAIFEHVSPPATITRRTTGSGRETHTIANSHTTTSDTSGTVKSTALTISRKGEQRSVVHPMSEEQVRMNLLSDIQDR